MADFSSQQQNNNNRHYSQHFNTDVELFGDRITISQIVLLLTYIRYHVQNKIPGDIKVSIGKNLETEFFTFTVNGQELPHVIAQKTVEIN